MIGNADDFRALVHSEAQNEPNPHILAERIVGKLAGHPDALLVALAVTAPGWIANFVKRPRMHDSDAPVIGDEKPATPVFAEARTYTDAEGNRRASAKTAGLVGWWAAQLRKSVCVGPTPQDWKRFGSCTVPDLLFMVGARRAKAQESIDAAERYEALAAEMRERGVETVGDLPEEIGKKLLA